MKHFIKPYRTGDVVLIKGRTDTCVIEDVEIIGLNAYEYATTSGAWFDHEQLTLVREADEESINELLLSREEEELGEEY